MTAGRKVLGPGDHETHKNSRDMNCQWEKFMGHDSWSLKQGVPKRNGPSCGPLAEATTLWNRLGAAPARLDDLHGRHGRSPLPGRLLLGEHGRDGLAGKELLDALDEVARHPLI